MNAFCTQCGVQLIPDANFCQQCGHNISHAKEPSKTAEPGFVLISMMWLLEFVSIIAGVNRVAAIAYLFGFLSLAIAIYLVTRKTYAERVNGWLRIGLGLGSGLIVFFRYLQP